MRVDDGKGEKIVTEGDPGGEVIVSGNNDEPEAKGANKATGIGGETSAGVSEGGRNEVEDEEEDEIGRAHV